MSRFEYTPTDPSIEKDLIKLNPITIKKGERKTMTKEKLLSAMAEAGRFLTRANAALTRKELDLSCGYSNSKEDAAVKRASMDLSRALAELRKPDRG
jgi:DNA topoisomerase IA